MLPRTASVRRKHLQVQPPRARISHPSSHPTHQAGGQCQTPRIFPQERSAGLISARDTKAQVQGQEPVLWTANGSQAPHFLPSLSDLTSDTSPLRPWKSKVLDQTSGPPICSPCFQGSGPLTTSQRVLGE